MKLKNYLSPENILLKRSYKNKQELLETMAKQMAKSRAAVDYNLSYDQILSGINNREKQSSTGIGDSFAFPHARFKQLDDIGICLAIIENSVDYQSFDNKPVTVACMIIVPEGRPTIALKIMSQVAKLFSHPSVGKQIQSAVSQQEVMDLIIRNSFDMDTLIIAADIMRQPLCTFSAEMPLKDATRKMSELRITSVPVVKAGKVIGEITTDELFKLGIPQFFTQLQSVSFIDEFDPFEKYFYEESNAKVSDLMSSRFCVMPPHATIMEIIFALAVQKYPKVYIENDGQLEGVIDQSLVLERIINI